MDLSGCPLVQFETLCAYHPGFALAILNGVSVRPSMRVVQATFSSPTLNQPIPASFDQIITSYSVFAGCDVSIDPTNAFPGNPLKTTSDYFQALGASGIRFQILARTRDDNDYAPIPSDTPLQMAPSILRKAAGIWHMTNPDNIKAQFTLGATPPAVPLTVWLTFSFLVLGPLGEDYIRLPTVKARAQLAAMLRSIGMGGGAGAQPSTP